MTAPAAAVTGSQYSLSNPPPGAQFVRAEVKTDRGKTSLGEIPILEWGETEEDILNAIAFYGPKGISDILGGTSLRVSFQGIGRTAREKAAADPSKAGDATDEAIALAQLKFRPSSREGGVSTPASRMAAAARKVAGKVNENAFAQLLAMVAEGKIDTALLKQAGIENAEEFYQPAAASNGAEGEEAETPAGE